MNDIADCFVLAADGDGEVGLLSLEECEVDEEVLTQF